MKRSELYEKVWAVPRTRLARELGISDVGLSKVCRRHAVPVPPRGYWAKKAAGQTPVAIPLPAPELDSSIDFRVVEPEERDRVAALRQREVQIANERSERMQANPQILIAEALERPHRLVAETARYAASIPKIISRFEQAGTRAWQMPSLQHPPHERFGRYEFLNPDRLDITASLAHIDWILRFHDAFIKAIVAKGMKIAYIARERNESARVMASLAGESVSFAFTEGYKRERLDEGELAKLKREKTWGSEWRYHASGKFTLKLSGTIYGAREEWTGSQEAMDSHLGDIVQAFLELVPRQKELRIAHEEARRLAEKVAAAAAKEQERRRGRADQLKRAFEMAETYNKVQGLKQFLNTVEAGMNGMAEPYAGRCRVWLDVVRIELDRAGDLDGALAPILSKPNWGEWPPSWWPQEANPPSES